MNKPGRKLGFYWGRLLNFLWEAAGTGWYWASACISPFWKDQFLLLTSWSRFQEAQEKGSLPQPPISALASQGHCSPDSWDLPILGRQDRGGGREVEVHNSVDFNSPGSYQKPSVCKATERNEVQSLYLVQG